MKTTSLSDLKKDLRTLSPAELTELCMRMAKYKKENKELLSYLLYDSSDERLYIKEVKILIDMGFDEINHDTFYYEKKSLRKILRTTNKYIKYSGLKQTEAELLIYFCGKMKKSGIAYEKSVAMSNFYIRQMGRIKKAVDSLHEDLQHDFEVELKKL
ncbi:MAG: hypothetical protein V2A54_17920 [Bacteroidota bacterium]